MVKAIGFLLLLSACSLSGIAFSAWQIGEEANAPAGQLEIGVGDVFEVDRFGKVNSIITLPVCEDGFIDDGLLVYDFRVEISILLEINEMRDYLGISSTDRFNITCLFKMSFINPGSLLLPTGLSAPMPGIFQFDNDSSKLDSQSGSCMLTFSGTSGAIEANVRLLASFTVDSSYSSKDSFEPVYQAFKSNPAEFTCSLDIVLAKDGEAV